MASKTPDNKNKLPFDPKGKIFHWGPAPGKFFYLSVFVETHYKHFRAKYQENWSETLALFKNGRMFWLCDLKAIEQAGQKVFIRYMLPGKISQKIYQEWKGHAKSLIKLEIKIDQLNLKQIAQEDLLKIWNDFHTLWIKFWVTGSVPELANYGSISYLKAKLQPYLAAEDLAPALATLTAPTKLSFYQEEEIALSAAQDLPKHQKQYFWLKNSYAGTQILPLDFFAQRQPSLKASLKKEMEQKIAQTKRAKKQLQKQFKLGAANMKIAEAISYGMGWQDERKKHIFVALHYLDLLGKEIARRGGYQIFDFDNLWYFEVAQILKGENLRPAIAERNQGFGLRYFHTCQQLSPKQTTDLWSVYEAQANQAGPKEVKGIVVSQGDGGKIRGKIHILLDPAKVHSFKKGEILVAPMTSPEYIFAMKKAIAVLTDTGGLTSHAAIVSRELNIPCLVDTKISTKIFQDGDMVEIDPILGIAKKI